MKKNLRNLFLLSGWILFLIFLVSGYFVNKFSDKAGHSLFTPITWEERQSVFKGAIVCSLTSEELRERKQELKTLVFSKLRDKTELDNGYIYYFDDEKGLVENIMDLIAKEKKCCPFFKFDLSILPFGNGIALQISGSEEIKDFLEDFEES